jgi:hypothetical protein
MSRQWKHYFSGVLAAYLLLGAGALRARGQSVMQSPGGQPMLEQLLPDSMRQNTDIDAWGWFSYLRNNGDEHRNYLTGDVALGVTQRIGDSIAATADFHFLGANHLSRGFLEQAFVTARLSESAGTLLTVGKFNASFGTEARDEWNRLAGTMSLLFGAEPQDLVGIMLTQPLGDSGISVRPFVAAQFQGHASFYGPPSGGITVDYRPSNTLHLSLTNWIGPGLEADLDDVDEEYTVEYTEDWAGPMFSADREGTLYFVDAAARWYPRPDVTVAAEGLAATVGSSAGTLGWGGLMLMGNYDLSDRWRVFGRWSYLNDAMGIVTGLPQTRNELSVGAGWQFVRGIEVRGEYRHDFARSDDLDSFSVHLTFSL